MELLEAVHSRRSVRKFTEEPVAWGDVVSIIESGMSAPSSGNLQNWKFVIVTDENKRRQIAEACLQQYWLEKAPIIIVVCSPTEKINQYYGMRGERLYAIQNCAAAVENMLLTAHSLGLGSCWVGAFDENAVQRVLENPDNVRIETIIPIGHPDEKPEEPMHLKIESTCFFDKWGNRIKDMDSVLWNHNIGGKAIDLGRKAGASISRGKKSMLEKIKSMGARRKR
ncbi:MAG: nitroreductase family protein [Candidatus Woesearchaeota archaeon]|nr:nitroreductase family protein [Candidatus Woesearchaeota archaeon]